MMNHESYSAEGTEIAPEENPIVEMGAAVELSQEGISAETVQPETLGEYYDHCVGMGEEQPVRNFDSEEEFFKETGFRLGDVIGNTEGL
jgi:hypothetical protein